MELGVSLSWTFDEGLLGSFLHYSNPELLLRFSFFIPLLFMFIRDVESLNVQII